MIPASVFKVGALQALNVREVWQVPTFPVVEAAAQTI